MAGVNFVHTYENATFQKQGEDANRTHFKTDARETAIKLCPGLKKLIIQAKLTDFDAVMLSNLNLKLTKLYISIENLSLVNFPKFEKLRTLHLVYNSSKDLKVVEVVEKRILKAAFPPTLTRVCLTGIYLTEDLLNHLATLPNLMCLDLIGCLVDSRVGAKYIPLLEKFPALEELSIPPSMFSFSVKARTPADITLQKLKVTKIGIFMDQFDDDVFYSQTRHFFPEKLKVLVVFGNYTPLKRWKFLKSIQNFKIIFGPNTSLASCPQANLTNVKLLSHMVRCPPYIPQDYSPNFLRNHDVLLGNLNWQFSLVEWKDNNNCKNEVMALRQSMNASENEEVVFEGLRIPAPVILERFGQMRNRRMPVSPEGFQVFDVIAIPQAPPLPGRLPVPITPLPPAPPPTLRRSRRNRRGRQLGRHVVVASRRRNRSAPPAVEEVPVTRPPRQSDSMETNPPSPPVPTNTGVVFNATLSNVSPIGVTTASIVGTRLSVIDTRNTENVTNQNTSVLNRGFVETPGSSSLATLGSSESRRLSTLSMNSEMTTATASPERLSQNPRGTGGQNNGAPPQPPPAATNQPTQPPDPSD
ncbi:hypothetical protein CAEBREN_19188 [Caenorhabditis brenneri]|uniref:Uncharacterized protein n=1 Tax=Caenorhabditis brenneri TaxID=135651 RepID=G0N770_CAEBE|nr:hypothetical protein CAEBREN_19188 [Caenorhabditis brenneri]